MIRDFEVPTERGGPTHRITCFLPQKTSRSDRGPPVVYCTDGASVVALSDALSAAIERETTPPVILVSVHCSPLTRAEEYLQGVDPERFHAHEEFFVNTVAEWLRFELGLSPVRSERAVFGFSNGGAFAVSMGQRHPDRFGQVIAFSVARSPTRPTLAAGDPVLAPRYYLASGTTGSEKMFRKNTALLARELRNRGIECEYFVRSAGHDFQFWKHELPLAIRWAFDGDAGNKSPLAES